MREEEWTDSLNPFKYVDKSIANYNLKKMTVGTGKEKKITASKSDWEKRLQPLKLDPIRSGYGPGDRKWTGRKGHPAEAF